MKEVLIGTNVLLLACLVALLAIFVSVGDVKDRLRSIDSNLGQLVEDGTFLRVPPPAQEGA